MLHTNSNPCIPTNPWWWFMHTVPSYTIHNSTWVITQSRIVFYINYWNKQHVSRATHFSEYTFISLIFISEKVQLIIFWSNWSMQPPLGWFIIVMLGWFIIVMVCIYVCMCVCLMVSDMTCQIYRSMWVAQHIIKHEEIFYTMLYTSHQYSLCTRMLYYHQLL